MARMLDHRRLDPGRSGGRVPSHPSRRSPARARTRCAFGRVARPGAAPGLHAMRRTDARIASSSTGVGRTRALGPGKQSLRRGGPCTRARRADDFVARLHDAARSWEDFDGRAVEPGAPFDVQSRSRWLAGPTASTPSVSRRPSTSRHRRSEPLLVLGTSFALVMLLDALKGRSLAAPDRTIVMTTGGFKGRTREISPAELVRDVASAFGIAETGVVGEYGMTELTSQLYEGNGGDTLALTGSAASVFLPPPWLRVSAVDPETLAVLPEGEIGLGRFVDLGNVDSAVAIVTQDLVRRVGGGIELLGRRPGAPLRGCSLAIEEMVLGAGAP